MKVSFSNDTHPPLELAAGSNLSENLDISYSPVLFGCRTGICGTCLIEIDAADVAKLPPPTEDELEMLAIVAGGNPHARLACQIDLQADIKVRYLGMT